MLELLGVEPVLLGPRLGLLTSRFGCSDSYQLPPPILWKIQAAFGGDRIGVVPWRLDQ